MKGFLRYMGAQFALPTGFVGRAASRVMSSMNRRQYRGVELALSPVRSGKLLEIGFGSGVLAGELAKAKAGCTLYGIDLSQDMLAVARARNERYLRNGKMFLRLGDAAALPYRDDTFAGVYTVNTVYFWQDPEACFREIYRVLKKGGIFGNAYYDKKWLDRLPSTREGFRKYLPEELEEMARAAGFQKVRTVPLKKDQCHCLIIEKET